MLQTVIDEWRTAAINIINECTKGADEFIVKENATGKDVSANVRHKIVGKYSNHCNSQTTTLSRTS